MAATGAAGDAAQAIQVAVRVRPQNARETANNDAVAVQVRAEGEVVVTPPNASQPRVFTFDYSYGIDANQIGIYGNLGQALVNNAADGYNSCLFAYGQTGAGKSWSILGDTKQSELRGLLPRICKGIFTRFRDLVLCQECRVVCTYLEIYNERIKDLLTTSETSLDVRKHPLTGICVPNLTEAVVNRYDDVQALLATGDENRTVAATAMNAQSSRSHAVFTLSVAQTPKGGTHRKAQLHVVDLAGSERQKKTQADGAKLKEGAAINQSLTVLGQVIFSLAAQAQKKGGMQHVPFRNSKLTHLLSDSLSGNSKTVMLAAVSPASSNVDETLNTLRFAQSVKQVKTRAVKNEVSEQNQALIINELRQQIEVLRASLEKASLAGSGGPCAQKPADNSDGTNIIKMAVRASMDCDETDSIDVLGADPWDQQQCGFAEQVAQIERSIASTGTDETKRGIGGIATRFVELREKVENANFIMSWMMEYNFMPRSDGQSTWLAVISWKSSAEPPHLLGSLRAQLHEREQKGVHRILLDVDEDDFCKVYRKFETQYEGCLAVLNDNETAAGHEAGAELNGHCQILEAPKAKKTRRGAEGARAPVAEAEDQARNAASPCAPSLERGSSAQCPPTPAERTDTEEVARLRRDNARLEAEVLALREKLEACQPQSPATADQRNAKHSLAVPAAKASASGPGSISSAAQLQVAPLRPSTGGKPKAQPPPLERGSSSGAISRRQAPAHEGAAPRRSALSQPVSSRHAPPSRPSSAKRWGLNSDVSQWPACRVELMDTE
mmetsp:Transcript_54697/g.152598  ORF Transcript_54697/g.152598 Transcript_54697/m.152598 type:complete len:783 (-) Transcript_54697:45-2393(-)